MRSGRILIIDDSITIRAMVEQLLATQGNYSEIAMAPDVATARQLIKTFRPTIITLDLNMPEVNGLTLLDELKGNPHAPIVVVSSTTKDGSAAAREAIEHGADACFDKSRILSETARFIRVLTKASLTKRREAKMQSRLARAEDRTHWAAHGGKRKSRAPALSVPT